MQCPHCAYLDANETRECPQCHGTYPVAACEELAHLRYTREFVDFWWANGAVPGRVARHLLGVTDAASARLRGQLGAPPIGHAQPAQAAPPTPFMAPVIAAPASGSPPSAPTLPHDPQAPDGQDATPSPLSPSAPAAPTVPLGPRIPAGRRATPLPISPATASGRYVPAGRHAAPLVPPRAAPPPPSRPVRPARPPRPAFSWKQVGAYLLSERTLNGLLGLGAFLILAAAVVISTLNPTGLLPPTHLAAMIVTTMVFYGAGAFVQQRLKLMVTGGALLAIGAAFVPLDVWTLGRDIMDWPPGTIWLIASLLGLPLYLASHIWLRDRAFALLTAVAGGSLLATLSIQAGMAPIWAAVALLGLSLVYLALAARLRVTWAHLSWAFFWTAQTMVPALLAVLTALRFGYTFNLALPLAWQQTLGAQAGASLDYAVGAAWWLCAGFYALAAILFRQRGFAYAAAWIVPCATLITLTKAPFAAAWYGLCLAGLATLYLLGGRLALRQTPSTVRALLTEPVYQVAATLTLVAALWPALTLSGRFTGTAEIDTLLLVSLTYGAAAFALKLRACAYIAVYTLPVAYGLLLAHLGLGLDAQTLGWALLAAALVACAELAARRTGEHRRPLTETAKHFCGN